MRVLVAEDEERLAALLEQALLEAGHAPSVVHDGEAALAAARRGGFDVLLLDWMLPGVEGPDVVRALRADGYDTPALLLTARATLQDRVGVSTPVPTTTWPSPSSRRAARPAARAAPSRFRRRGGGRTCR